MRGLLFTFIATFSLVISSSSSHIHFSTTLSPILPPSLFSSLSPSLLPSSLPPFLPPSLPLLLLLSPLLPSSVSRPGPDYSVGIEYVESSLGGMRKKRHRVVQLAEARRLTLQQCKQLHSCESDARQVSWQSCDHCLAVILWTCWLILKFKDMIHTLHIYSL